MFSRAASLRISDVDLETNRIRVTIHKIKDVDLMVIPVELRPILREWLAFYAAEQGPLNPDWYLIPAKTGTRFGVTSSVREAPSRVTTTVEAFAPPAISGGICSVKTPVSESAMRSATGSASCGSTGKRACRWTTWRDG